jgi:hypothetical protein
MYVYTVSVYPFIPFHALSMEFSEIFFSFLKFSWPDIVDQPTDAHTIKLLYTQIDGVPVRVPSLTSDVSLIKLLGDVNSYRPH